MASESTNTFGFELMQKLTTGQINKKEDVLILVVHWYLVKNGFKCLGCGDSKNISPSEDGSELLPEGWSQEQNYSLRYVKEAKLYILMAIKSDNDLILNLLKVETHDVSNVQLPIETVKNLQGPLVSLIPNFEDILTSLKNNLIEPVNTSNGVEVSTQTSDSQTEANRLRRDDDDNPLRVGPPQRPPGQIIPGSHPIDPFGIGHNDLNPFGHGRGGGMLFDPFSRRQPPIFPGLGVPGRLPPGAVPPHARFDPFGPPHVDPPNPRGNVPDADHMPPPGYDDMFM